jgi:hypothetical protein
MQGLLTMDSTDEEVREWMQTRLNVLSPRRRWHTQRAALNLWAYLGRQWVRPRSQLRAGEGVYHFDEVYRQSSAAFPRPVTNLIGPAVDNEIARLTRKDYVADTSLPKRDPEWQAAANLGRDIVRWELTKQLWTDKREDAAFNLCVDGITGVRTWWDENQMDLFRAASPNARQCPACQRKFASNVIPRGYSSIAMPTPEGPQPMQHKETLSEWRAEPGQEAYAGAPEGVAQLVMANCPFCADRRELERFDPSEDEANDLADAFGNPLGIDVARGDANLDVCNVHEYFPENGGIGVEPNQERMHQQITVRPLDWIATRIPDLADSLTPEPAEQLIRLNPLYSDRAFAADRTGLFGIDSYRNHARFHEVVFQAHEGIPGLERGAWFMMVNDKIHRRELCVEVETERGKMLIPRVTYNFARFKRVPRNWHGWTFVDDLLPVNRRLNQIDAQITDLRERGVPHIWKPKGIEVTQRDDLGGSMRTFEYDGAGLGWTPKEGLFPGQPLTGNVYFQERRDILEDAKRVGFPYDIEMGGSEGSVKTTSGLMLMSEEAAQKRGPRERALAKMYEGSFKTILNLNYAFRKEEAAYEVRTEIGQLEESFFEGDMLRPGLNVQLKAAAGYQQTLYDKEATTEALQLGLYPINSEADRITALENMKLPTNINEQATKQMKLAEGAWSAFKRERIVPIPDHTIDDPILWYQVLRKSWFSEECQQMQAQAGWDSILPATFGWQEKMESMLDVEEQFAPYKYAAKDQYGDIYAEGTRRHAEATAAIQQANLTGAAVQAQPQPLPPPFPEPPPENFVFLPDAPEQRVYAVWLRLLPDVVEGFTIADEAVKIEGDNPASEQLQLLEALMKYRAVIEGYRLQAAKQMMAAAPMEPQQ